MSKPGVGGSGQSDNQYFLHENLSSRFQGEGDGS